MNQTLSTVLKVVTFIVCIALVIWGQRTTGYIYLAVQLIGLAGILVLLYLYNKSYQ